jgi:hypothetical protein
MLLLRLAEWSSNHGWRPQDRFCDSKISKTATRCPFPDKSGSRSRPELVPHPSSPPPGPRPCTAKRQPRAMPLRDFLPPPAQACLTTRIQHIASRTGVVGFEERRTSAHLHHHIRLCFLDALAGSFHSLCSPQPSIQQAFGRYTCVTFLHRSIIPGSEYIILRSWLFVPGQLVQITATITQAAPAASPHSLSRSEDQHIPGSLGVYEITCS